MLSTFSCTFGYLCVFLGKMSIQILWPLLIGILVFTEFCEFLSFVSFSYISGINFIRKMFCKQNFPICRFPCFLFMLLFLYFLCRSFLVWCCLTCLFLICCFGVILKNVSLSRLKSKLKGLFRTHRWDWGLYIWFPSAWVGETLPRSLKIWCLWPNQSLMEL